jgi:hypothetical protein
MNTVPDRPTSSQISAAAVHAGLAAALRRRRLRDRTRQAWRAAPLVAAAALVAAATSPLTGWPVWSVFLLLGIGGAGLALHVGFALITGPVSDRVASAIDREAGLEGELRSASWFAARDGRDAWADEHLSRAGTRLQAVEWRRVYPPARPGRSGLTTVALTLAALAVAAWLPGRGTTRAAIAAGEPPAQTAPFRVAEHLPPELLRQLEQLLAAAERGDRAATQALSSNASLRDMLTELARANDPALLEALARAAASSTSDRQALDAMEALAERARRAAEASGMSTAMQDALQELADQLEIAAPERSGRGAAASGDPVGPDGASADGTAGEPGQLHIRFVEDGAAGGAGVLILPPGGDEGADAPGAGVGGSPSGEIPPGSMAGLHVALDREVVEAHQDAPGSTVEAERPRQTEQGQAEAAYRGGRAAAFEGTATAAPPPVPEARRSRVRDYFVRTPQ